MNLFENLQKMHKLEKIKSNKSIKENLNDMTEEEANYIYDVIKEHENDSIISFEEVKRRYNNE